jgi:PqqD family protein of HPr-rel-A system
MNAPETSPQSPSEADRAWRVSGQARWRLWEDEAVIYNGRSGDTHHLADFAAWVFGFLSRGPASEAGLTRAAETQIELTSGKAPGDAIARTLDLLRRLDLIERAA